MPMLTSPHGENPIGPLSRAPRPASRTTRFEADSSMGSDVRARWPPYAPFCSDGIGLSVLPGASRLLGLAPVGCRRLTRSRINVTAGRIILDAGCVVSAPLPALSGPPLARGHHSEGGGTFLSDPERPPSAVRGRLGRDLAMQNRTRTGVSLFALALVVALLARASIEIFVAASFWRSIWNIPSPLWPDPTLSRVLGPKGRWDVPYRPPKASSHKNLDARPGEERNDECQRKQGDASSCPILHREVPPQSTARIPERLPAS